MNPRKLCLFLLGLFYYSFFASTRCSFRIYVIFIVGPNKLWGSLNPTLPIILARTLFSPISTSFLRAGKRSGKSYKPEIPGNSTTSFFPGTSTTSFFSSLPFTVMFVCIWFQAYTGSTLSCHKARGDDITDWTKKTPQKNLWGLIWISNHTLVTKFHANVTVGVCF